MAEASNASDVDVETEAAAASERRARAALFQRVRASSTFSVIVLAIAITLSVALGFVLISFSGDFDFRDETSWRQQSRDSPAMKGRGSAPGQPRPMSREQSSAEPSPRFTSPAQPARSATASPARAAPQLQCAASPAHVSPPPQLSSPLPRQFSGGLPGGQAAGGHEAGLCPELVVPDGSECVLAIPTLESLPAHAATLEHCIVDKTGEPLLRIIVERKVGQGPGVAQETLERLTLAAWKDGYALVSAEVHVPTGRTPQGGPYCIISHPQGQVFARVEEVAGEGQASTFVLSSATGAQWQYRIHGFVQDRSLTVTTSAAQLVAAVEPGTSFNFETHGVEFYKLRVAPRVDAGLLSIAMLAIDRLSRSSASRRRGSVASV